LYLNFEKAFSGLVFVLFFTGYPIVNDPLYNHPAFGPDKGKNGVTGKTDEQLIEDLLKMHNSEFWLGMSEIEEGDLTVGACSLGVASPVTPACTLDPEKPTANDTESSDRTEKPEDALNEGAKAEVLEKSSHELPSTDPTYDSACPQCNGTVRFRDPKPENLVMYLHAWKYRGPGWEFQTEIPDWAKEDWTAS